MLRLAFGVYKPAERVKGGQKIEPRIFLIDTLSKNQTDTLLKN